MSVLLILAMGSLRDSDVSGIPPKRFWAAKARWQGCADMVVTGDSRVFVGVSPAEMARHLTGLRIRNYGFGANGYSTAYLRAAEEVLDPRSRRKLIVLGITPRSLTPASLKGSGFQAHRAKAADGSGPHPRFEKLFGFVEPLSFRDALCTLVPGMNRTHYYREYFADGWVATIKDPERPEQEIKNYRRMFEDSQVSPRIIRWVIRFVRRWHGAGIRVYGFRPSTSPGMIRLESRISGFDEASFAAALEAAGGRWVRLKQTAYHSYDGSHLRREAAVRMSRDLARAIQAREEAEHARPAAAPAQ